MSIKNNPTRLGIRSKLWMLVVSSRPISWVNTAFPFAAGYLASGGRLDLIFFVALLYFLIPYNVLIYVVNDVFDYESDLRNPRKGGIEGGLIPPSAHRFMLVTTAIINIPFLLVLFLNGSEGSNVVLLAVVVGALIYSMPLLRFKERPILDSATSSFHFVGPLLFALILTGWQAGYWPYLLAFFLWGMASHAFGAVQDIVADKKANIHSIATRFGAATTVRLSFMLYLLSSIILIYQRGLTIVAGITELLYLLMVAPYLHITDSDAEQANQGWKKFLKLNQFSGFVVTILILLNLRS